MNNVLAVAASYIEEDPDQARDVLAELGAFLTHRLRGPRVVSVTDEVEHVRVFLRLEQARYPERIVAEVAGDGALPAMHLAPGDLQAPLATALDRWLTVAPGRVRIALQPRGDAFVLQLDRPDDPAAPGERVRIVPGDAPAETAA